MNGAMCSAVSGVKTSLSVLAVISAFSASPGKTVPASAANVSVEVIVWSIAGIGVGAVTGGSLELSIA
ncbi:MAG: hypothetical protein ACN6I5_04960 [Hyphomicrobiales bacterium]